MKILVINAGSSSLKYQLFDMENGEVLAKGLCEKIGLSIIAYTVGANFLCDDPEAEIKRVCGCIDVAKALGAPVLRHDVCYALPKNPLYTWRDAIKDMAPRIRRVTEYAKSLGIKTCTENHGYIFQAPEELKS